MSSIPWIPMESDSKHRRLLHKYSIYLLIFHTQNIFWNYINITMVLYTKILLYYWHSDCFVIFSIQLVLAHGRGDNCFVCIFLEKWNECLIGIICAYCLGQTGPEKYMDRDEIIDGTCPGMGWKIIFLACNNIFVIGMCD